MNLFKQKPGYSSRPLDWLHTGGRGKRAAARRFFRHLSDTCAVDSARATAPRLLCYRTDFRRLVADEQVVLFQRYLSDANPLVRSLAVWMLGQCANRCNLLGIENYCQDASPMVRKHVAKALYRLEAHQILREMSLRYPSDAAVQWFAQDKPNNTRFEERLSDFSRHVVTSQPQHLDSAEPMTFWARFENWLLTPPKSNSYIRAILERIRKAARTRDL